MPLVLEVHHKDGDIVYLNITTLPTCTQFKHQHREGKEVYYNMKTHPHTEF